MAIYNKPDENVFASSAKQGEVSNFPDIGRGWGISFDQTGGIPPMEWFNFLFKRNDEKFGYLFQRGLSEWSETQEYPIGALVQYKNLTYKAKRANANKKPDQADSLDWQRWGFTQSELKSATLTESGITQLLTSVNSDDETKAATPKSVKVAYSKGVEADSNANGRVSKSGDSMAGVLDSVGVTSKQLGYGAYSSQYESSAPFYVNQASSVARGAYHPFIKGKVREHGQYSASFSFGYTTKQISGEDGYGFGAVHLITDAGNDKLWRFNHNGEFVSAGDVITGNGRSLNSAIYREGNPHDIAMSWQRDGLKVRVDNVDVGRVAYKSDLNSKVDVGQIDAGNRYIRVQGSLLVISGGTAGGVEQSGSVYNSFPISFPNTCVAVIPVHVGTDQTTNVIIESGSVTKYGFNAKTSHKLNASIDYIAFGY